MQDNPTTAAQTNQASDRNCVAASEGRDLRGGAGGLRFWGQYTRSPRLALGARLQGVYYAYLV